jgi:hypothetical protein
MPGLADICRVCGNTYPYSLPRCGFCRRAVCGNCGNRIGGAVFCGKTCSHSFFYGGEEDIEEEAARGGGDPEDE